MKFIQRIIHRLSKSIDYTGDQSKYIDADHYISKSWKGNISYSSANIGHLSRSWSHNILNSIRLGGFYRLIHRPEERKVNHIFCVSSIRVKSVGEDGWPIDTRNWGFYFDEEKAINTIEINYTNLQEAGWYKYAVIQKCYEGIFDFTYLDDMIFFDWDRNKESWNRLPAIPTELLDIFNHYSVLISFSDMG